MIGTLEVIASCGLSPTVLPKNKLNSLRKDWQKGLGIGAA